VQEPVEDQCHVASAASGENAAAALLALARLIGRQYACSQMLGRLGVENRYHRTTIDVWMDWFYHFGLEADKRYRAGVAGLESSGCPAVACAAYVRRGLAGWMQVGPGEPAVVVHPSRHDRVELCGEIVDMQDRG
jgi:hypothetical protein